MLLNFKDDYRVHTMVQAHHFYLHGEIGCSSEYVDLLDCLYSATSGDVIYIHLNTPGGRLNTAVEIIHAIVQSEGTVVTCADGLAASAGSLIFFCGSSFVVGEFSEVMLHDGSSGELGKINENLKSAMFTSARLSAIYHSVYGKYFTPEEVDKVLNGEDLYLTAFEVEERIAAVLGEKEEIEQE
jgi:ATP-dependent protease ClpP protease subunit